MVITKNVRLHIILLLSVIWTAPTSANQEICEGWCHKNQKAWTTKCTWQLSCSGCSICAEEGTAPAMTTATTTTATTTSTATKTTAATTSTRTPTTSTIATTTTTVTTTATTKRTTATTTTTTTATATTITATTTTAAMTTTTTPTTTKARLATSEIKTTITATTTKLTTGTPKKKATLATLTTPTTKMTSTTTKVKTAITTIITTTTIATQKEETVITTIPTTPTLLTTTVTTTITLSSTPCDGLATTATTTTAPTKMPDTNIATTLYLDTTTSIANNELFRLPSVTEMDTVSVIAIVSGLLIAICITVIVCGCVIKYLSKKILEDDNKLSQTKEIEKSAAAGSEGGRAPTLRVEFNSPYEDCTATISYAYTNEVVQSQPTECHVDIDAYHRNTDVEITSRYEDNQTTQTTQTKAVSPVHFKHEPQYCVSQILVDMGDNLQKQKTVSVKPSGYDCPYPDS